MLQMAGLQLLLFLIYLRENKEELGNGGGRGGGVKISPTQTRVKCVYYDFFGTFFIIPEMYQVLVLNLKWIALR